MNQEQLDQIIESLEPSMIAAISISEKMSQRVAKLYKKYYDEFVEVGFTPEQAIELCTKANLVGGK